MCEWSCTCVFGGRTFMFVAMKFVDQWKVGNGLIYDSPFQEIPYDKQCLRSYIQDIDSGLLRDLKFSKVTCSEIREHRSSCTWWKYLVFVGDLLPTWWCCGEFQPRPLYFLPFWCSFTLLASSHQHVTALSQGPPYPGSQRHTRARFPPSPLFYPSAF